MDGMLVIGPGSESGAYSSWAPPRACSSAGPAPWLDPLRSRIQRRHRAATPSSLAPGPEPIRTRGDRPGPGSGSVDAGGRIVDPAGSLHGEPRGRPPWGSRGIPSRASRSEGVGQRPSPEALSAGGSSRAPEDRGPEAEPGWVARTDLSGVAAAMSGRPGRGQIVDAVSIRGRPAEAEGRAVPGRWEGDLLAGSNNTHIATGVERRSRFTMLVKVSGKDTQTVAKALTRHVRRLPAEVRRSLTWDRGLEMATHKEFSIATNVQVYFCDPRSPWQRGTNENTNRLLRQDFPKGTDLSACLQADLSRTARQLNQRPRKTLDFRSPAEGFNQRVASTG